jgi:hypothetical protein
VEAVSTEQQTIKELRDALREIVNRAGAPTCHYGPEVEREEQRESLNWIAMRAANALSTKKTESSTPL